MHKNEAAAIEKLLYFALDNDLIKQIDVIYSRNLLLDLMDIKEPVEFDSSEYDLPDMADIILDELLDIAVEKNLIENTITERDLFDTKIMNTIMPRPSEVFGKFKKLSIKSIKNATDWFYQLNNSSEYIRRNRIDKNIKWNYEDDKYGTFEITINLSKPEKDSREIAKLLTLQKSGYPACVLCAENMGYAGRYDHPARQTLRLIPLILNNESWYMQYSPYVYYNEHCIVLRAIHNPMIVSRDTFVRLIDFVEIIPHYFLGSNAGLSIVGGSILNHDHYQGGGYVLPMAKAAIKQHFKLKDYKNIDAGIVNWPMNTLRLTSNNKDEIINAATHILKSWEGYQDPDYGVINNIDGILHNAVTPYASMIENNYKIDIVLRNNITSIKYPLGVYHPHPELHHIKKENIGLIEVTGLFILPGRLKTELSLIEDILCGRTKYDNKKLKDHEKLSKHLPWIERLVAVNGTSMDKDDVKKLFQDEIGRICRKILECSGVYKDTDKGHKGLMRFLEYVGINLN